MAETFPGSCPALSGRPLTRAGTPGLERGAAGGRGQEGKQPASAANRLTAIGRPRGRGARELTGAVGAEEAGTRHPADRPELRLQLVGGGRSRNRRNRRAAAEAVRAPGPFSWALPDTDSWEFSFCTGRSPFNLSHDSSICLSRGHTSRTLLA